MGSMGPGAGGPEPGRRAGAGAGTVPSMSAFMLRDHLRAALLLGAGGMLLMAGFPGLDFLSPKDLRVRVERAHRIAAPLGAVAEGLAAFDARVRRPVARLIKPVERTFRIAQEFHLYRDGPRRVDRLEVLVDGVLVYRTRDADHAWRAAQFGNRHLRPMVATAAQKPRAVNQAGIARWIVAQARQDFPDAEEVVIRSTRADFGAEASWVRFWRVARSPGWSVSGVHEEEAP